MDIRIQLLSLFVSFIYGGFYYLSSLLNKKLIIGKRVIVQFLITIIFVLNNVLIYLIILYKTNCGKYHIYFMIMLALGFIFASYVCKKYVNRQEIT